MTQPDPDSDERLCHYVCELHRQGDIPKVLGGADQQQQPQQHYDVKFMREYVKQAREFTPMIAKDNLKLMEMISNEYVKKRQEVGGRGLSTFTCPYLRSVRVSSRRPTPPPAPY